MKLSHLYASGHLPSPAALLFHNATPERLTVIFVREAAEKHEEEAVCVCVCERAVLRHVSPKQLLTFATSGFHAPTKAAVMEFKHSPRVLSSGREDNTRRRAHGPTGQS